MAHWPDREPVELERQILIDRRSKLPPNETMARYLIGEGRPVVVTDAQKDWKATKLWSVEYFKKHFADEELIASDRAPLRLEDNPKMQTLRTTLGIFCDYMSTPYHQLSAHERDAPFYGNSWSPFIAHPKLRGHITRPYFVPDSIPCSMGCPDDVPCTAAEPGHERLDRSFTKIFLGPAGTITRLHNDTYHTHAWLSQVRGTKQFILYPPSQAHALHAGEAVYSDKGSSQTWFDPIAPDYEKFPRARQATPYVAVCGPGDTILVPSDWYHYAVALTPSITLMRNFMNDHNAGPFFDVWNENADGNGQPKAKPSMHPSLIGPPALPPAKPGSTPPRLPSSSSSSSSSSHDGSAFLSSESAAAADERFEAADRFEGARPGMVFKRGDRGLGYYTDTATPTPTPPAGGAGRVSVAAVAIDHSRTVVRQPSPQRVGEETRRFDDDMDE